MTTQRCRNWQFVLTILLLFGSRHVQAQPEPSSREYVTAVRKFADRVLASGRDNYGKEKTPLFVDGLQVKSLEPAKWICHGETWILSNFASQQPLLRMLDGLTAITGDAKYRQAAEATTGHALTHLRSPNGLLYWGGHLAWDLEQDKPVGQYADVHEMKGHQPYYRLMWRVNPQATVKLLEMIWAGHVLDWSLLDYNRHASVRKELQTGWGREFNADIEVPFPTQGSNLSFVNVTPPLLHAGTMLAVLGQDPKALAWTRRLVYRWQQGKHPETGLCGGQLSYRQHDRAQDALGHVHPNINEAKIVASYHQTSRYHSLPVAQMQAAVTLMASGGEFAEVGRDFLDWASEDLKVYAQYSYDPQAKHFVALTTNGTPLQWQESREGYYVPTSFAPRAPDAVLLWGYALAYRLTQDPSHWRMARELSRQLGLGDLGRLAGEHRALELSTTSDDWCLIYGLLELHRATKDPELLRLACRVADNALKMQAASGLFPRPGRDYARSGDEIPLALLHLAAAVDGKRDLLPPATFDRRFFHCEYHGPLDAHQQKRADKRTYDHLVFYGSD